MSPKLKQQFQFFIPSLIFLVFLAIILILVVFINHSLLNIGIFSNVIIAGVALLFLLYGISFFFLKIHNRALELAKKSSSDLLSALNFRQAILDGANYSIISTEPNGIIKSMNAAAEKMLGYQASELVGKETPAIFHDAKEVEQQAKELSLEFGRTINPGFEVFVLKARISGSEEREWSYIRKDKSRLPVLLSITAIRNSENEITSYLGIASDLTETKKNSRYIQLQYQITKIISESTDFTISIAEIFKIIGETMGWDVGTLWQQDSQNKQLTCHNIWHQEDSSISQFSEKTGKTLCVSDLGGLNHVWKKEQPIIIHDLQEALYLQRASFAKAAGLKSAFALPLFYGNQFAGILEFLSREEQSFKFAELSNFISWLERLLGMLISQNEITENLRKSEEIYYQTGLRLKLATESAKIGIWDWNLVTNQLIWDDMMFEVYGEKPNASVNPYTYWVEHVHPEDQHRAESELQDGVKEKKQFNTVFRVIWSDGSLHYIRAIADVIKDGQNHPIKMVGVNWDITEEKIAEEKLKLVIEASPYAIVLVNKERRIFNHPLCLWS